jgi:Protein of unknown function (DUF2723)
MPEPAAGSRTIAPGLGAATLLGVVVLLVYLPTVAPTVTLRNSGGDGGDLVRAAWVLGVPHPTGYPLWVLLAHAATWFPFDEPAHRVALLSTLAAAAAVAMVALAGGELLLQADPKGAGWLRYVGPPIGGAVLAVSVLFWQQATIPETYALDSFLVALGLWLLLRWLRGDGVLWHASLVTALALANHLVSLSLLAALVVAVLVRRQRPSKSELAAAAAPFLLTVALYLFLLVRARTHPVANWGDPQTLPALWTQVSAGEYHHFLASRSPGQALLELVRWPGRLRAQFSVVGAVAAVWSLLLIAVRAPRAAAVLITALLVDLIIVARDAAPAGPSYLHVSYLVLATALGAGLLLLPATFSGDRRTLRLTGGVTCLGGVALAIFLGVHTRPAVDLHGDDTLEKTALADLAAVPPGGLLLTNGDNPLFALWYVQDVLGVRPDVVVWSLNLVLDPWYGEEMHRRYPAVIPAGLPVDEAVAADRVIAANLPSRPVDSVLADPLLTSRYALQPDGPIFRLVRPQG